MTSPQLEPGEQSRHQSKKDVAAAVKAAQQPGGVGLPDGKRVSVQLSGRMMVPFAELVQYLEGTEGNEVDDLKRLTP